MCVRACRVSRVKWTRRNRLKHVTIYKQDFYCIKIYNNIDHKKGNTNKCVRGSNSCLVSYAGQKVYLQSPTACKMHPFLTA